MHFFSNSEITSDILASPKALVRRSTIDVSGSFIRRESLKDENGNERSAEDVIRSTQAEQMDLDFQASKMGEKNPILLQRRGTGTGYAFSQDPGNEDNEKQIEEEDSSEINDNKVPSTSSPNILLR